MYVGDPIGINVYVWHVRWRPYRLYMFLYYMYVGNPIGIIFLTARKVADADREGFLDAKGSLSLGRKKD